jgi:hypothetical protein
MFLGPLPSGGWPSSFTARCAAFRGDEDHPTLTLTGLQGIYGDITIVAIVR